MKDVSELKNYREKYKRYYGIDFDTNYVIHHIDENRRNNNIDNLLLLPMYLHSKYHAYKDALNNYTMDGLCLDLTYSGSKLRGYQLSQLDELREVLNEVQEWIEYKFLADAGCTAYPMFKRLVK